MSEKNNKNESTHDKTRFDSWSYPYKKSYDKELFSYAEQGKSLTEIAYILEIPKDVIMGWTTDQDKRSFKRAYEASREACQAFHERLYNDMIQGRIEKVSAKQIDAQANVLKTMFKDDWNPVQKQELEINTNQMDDQEVTDKLRLLLESDHIRNHLKEIAKRNFTPDIKEVKDNE